MSPARTMRGAAVLVTGAADGMGRATAKVFAQDGARVAVTDINAAGAEEVAAAIRAEGGEARAWRLDVGDPKAIERVVGEVVGAFGGLDAVVNNAGIARFTPIDDPQYDAIFDRFLGVMLSAHQRIIRAALQHLRKSKHPRIVNIASTEALGATANNSAYCAAKAGVIGLTRALAVELGREGITVNCVCPGPIHSSMTADIPDTDKTIYAKRRTALRRYGAPEEVAHMTLSLCLPASSFVTGVVIPVDGGLSARYG